MGLFQGKAQGDYSAFLEDRIEAVEKSIQDIKGELDFKSTDRTEAQLEKDSRQTTILRMRCKRENDGLLCRAPT